MSINDGGPFVDLSVFCAKGDSRKYLNAPFSVSGGTAASDGFVIAWIDANTGAPEVPALSAKSAEHCISIAKSCKDDDAFIRANDVRISSRNCGECNGTGIVSTNECDDCDGDGYFVHGDHDYDCKKCGGDGLINIAGIGGKCSGCGGSGKSMVMQPSSIGNLTWTVSSHIIAKLQMLPNCKLRLCEDRPQAGLQFIFDGGCGIVMPLISAALQQEQERGR